MGRTGFCWLGIGPVAGLCEHGDESFGSIKKKQAIVWQAEWLSAFQMEWVSK
jgi:hypothetical protein